MKIPKQVSIKGKIWKITRRWGLTLEGIKADGICIYENRTIVLEQGLTKDETPLVFLHELNHAIFFELHIQDVDLPIEHVIVEGFADVYLDLFKISWKA